MDLIQVANFTNGRYLISNMKKDKIDILKGELLSSFSVGSLGSSYNEKVYYDTHDFFFANRGINIYTVSVANSKELIIRYDSNQVSRIEFLKNMPNYFKLKIAKDEGINKYFAQITEAIYKVFPSGLNINIEEMLTKCAPQVKVFKKRDSYRVVNNTGLKTVMSFDNCEYVNLQNKSKYLQPTLDVVNEGTTKKEDFEIFLKTIIRDYPQLIKLDSNELTVARSNL